MRQGHHIVLFSEVVQHHVRVHVGHRRVRKSPRGFPRFHFRVNPAFVEKRFGQFGHARVKIRVSIHHHRARLIPRNDQIILVGQGGVTVPNLHFIKAQPLGFQRIIPMR